MKQKYTLVRASIPGLSYIEAVYDEDGSITEDGVTVNFHGNEFVLDDVPDVRNIIDMLSDFLGEVNSL